MKFAVETDKGLIRDINEDSYIILPGSPNTPCVFIVADGMGGHNCGEMASSMAVEYISGEIRRVGSDICMLDDIGNTIRKLVLDTNEAVYRMSLERPETNGMGTTLTLAVITGKTVTVAHVGDSRLYLARRGDMRQVTEDHSYIGELIKIGSLTKEEAERHPRKHVITRAIGTSLDLEVDIITFEIESEDIILLCTDGLTNMVGDDKICGIIADNEPETACGELVRAAMDGGGDDNITVIVIKIE